MRGTASTGTAGEKQDRRRGGLVKAGWYATVSSVLAIIGVVALPGVADAATVYGYGDLGVMVQVDTGTKDYSNHTQWVSRITVYDIGSGSLYCDYRDPVEAWAGNVYYARVSGCGRGTSFVVNKWVPSGSGVCASFWRYTADWRRHYRGIACIGIRV